jgi:AraC-like DNA-binding protein
MQRSYLVESSPSVAKVQYWTNVISKEYFPVDAKPADPIHFSGKLTTWGVGSLSLSHLITHPIIYFREKRHVRADKNETILITFSARSELTYVQEGISLKCGKNQYFIEMAHRPYEFGHSDENEVWALHVPANLLRWHVRSVERYAPYIFDASRGVGALLFDTIRMMPRRLAECPACLHQDLGRCLVELLALSLEGNERVLGSSATNSVKKAHLVRIERFIRTNLTRPDLTPELIAATCNMSSSYLHQLFRNSGCSVGRWIRELRLNACDQDLRNPNCGDGIAEIAYRWGFSDHAQFCRHFKAYFGRTPRESRAGANAASQQAPASPDAFSSYSEVSEAVGGEPSSVGGASFG